jgi:hypothetical protein
MSHMGREQRELVLVVTIPNLSHFNSLAAEKAPNFLRDTVHLIVP